MKWNILVEIKKERKIRKHLKNLVKDLSPDIQKIVLKYNSRYSQQETFSSVVESAKFSLYQEISKHLAHGHWSKAYSLDELLSMLKQIE